MTIDTKAGVRIKIALFDAGQNPAGFTVNGTRCIHDVNLTNSEDESFLLIEIIGAIYRQQKVGQESQELSEFLARLRKARGEQPLTRSRG